MILSESQMAVWHATKDELLRELGTARHRASFELRRAGALAAHVERHFCTEGRADLARSIRRPVPRITRLPRCYRV